MGSLVFCEHSFLVRHEVEAVQLGPPAEGVDGGFWEERV
jgi:hypothetical protein